MKYKLSAAAIIFASLTIIAIMFFAIERIAEPAHAPEVQNDENQDHNAALLKDEPSAIARLANLRDAMSENSIPKEDEKIILDVVELSDHALQEEVSALRKRMEEEKLFGRLELKQMDPQKALETKALLERFTLLGIEQTRRKYLAIEPELKDALYAHRDSLKDIRGLLARY